MIPQVPTIYYFHCPSCGQVGEVLLEDLERMDDSGVYRYDCDCGMGQTMHQDRFAKDERQAYQLTIDNLLDINQRNLEYFDEQNETFQGHMLEISKKFYNLKFNNEQINTIVFIIEKNVRDIIKMLEKDDKDDAIKHAKYEAKDLLQFLLKEQDRTTRNEKETEKKAKSEHWSDFIQELYKEDEQDSKAKDS
jgi:hypothetical protein